MLTAFLTVATVTLMANSFPGSEKLRAWRLDESKARGRLTLVAAAALLEVEHPTWSQWESGRRPELAKAIEVENLTDGGVRIEDWGYERSVEAIRLLVERRAALATEAA